MALNRMFKGLSSFKLFKKNWINFLPNVYKIPQNGEK